MYARPVHHPVSDDDTSNGIQLVNVLFHIFDFFI